MVGGLGGRESAAVCAGAAVVPKPPKRKATCEQSSAADGCKPADKPTQSPPSPYRLNWAAALKRVWGIEIFDCARCGARLTIVAFIEKASAVKAILEHLALPSTPLPLGKATGPPQLSLGL